MIEIELWQLRTWLALAGFAGYSAGRLFENRRSREYRRLQLEADSENDPDKKETILLKQAARMDGAKYRNAFVSAKIGGPAADWFAIVVFLHQAWLLSMVFALYFAIETLAFKTNGLLLLIAGSATIFTRLAEKIIRKTKGLPE